MAYDGIMNSDVEMKRLKEGVNVDILLSIYVLHTYCTRLRLVIRLYHQHPDNQGNEM